MKNKKVILSSILSLVLCLSLMVGGTFALFTSESKANIAITSGNVEVAAWLDDIETSTFGTVQAENTFELGGTATYDSTSNKLTVDKIAPGDRVDFHVYIENKSNIAVSYRVKVAFAGELQEALVATIELPQEDGTTVKTVLTSADVATDWCSFDDTNKVKLPMSIELPYDVGDDDMNKSAEIIVTIEAVQANATDLVMIENTRYESLPDAIAAAQDGQTIYLSGVFTLPTDGSLKNRILTFKSIEDSVAVFDMRNVVTDQSTSGAALTFDGVDVVFDNTANYKGIQHAAAVIYNNCTITGKQFMYAATVEFNKCELVNYADYCVWTYGTNASFKDCIFTTGGKAILVYNEGVTDDTVTVENCIFNSNGQTATDKAAVETGINNADSKHTLIINNSTANGFAANKSNSPLWGNKNDMDYDHLKVLVDGVNQVTYKITVSDNNGDDLNTALAEAAKISNFIEIVLEEDVTISDDSVQIPEGVSDFTFDLNGKTITIEGNGNAATDRVFWTQKGTNLTITGNGTIDLGDSTSSLLVGGYADTITIENGTFKRNAYTNADDYYPLIENTKNADAGSKLIINGGYFDSGYYNLNDDGTPDCFNNCRQFINSTWSNCDIVIYGGTFVGANPAWGDEGMTALCTVCGGNSYCQQVFLDGQNRTDTELPAGYTITESTLEDGRPVFTVTYSK